MGHSDFQIWLLIVLVGNAAFGGVIFLALLNKGRVSYILAALIGAAAAFLIEPQVGRLSGGSSLPAWPLLATVGGAVAATLLRFLVGAALRDAKGIFDELAKVRDGAPAVLVPERWTLASRSRRVTARDQVRRWFVAISAANGAVVGSIVGTGFFWSALIEALDYRRVGFTILTTAVSVFLIGPLQNYITGIGIGEGPGADPGKEVADFFARGIDWRAAGRFGIVFVGYAQLSILMSCIEVAAQQGEAQIILNMAMMAITPAIVSYYWASALQLSAFPVRKAVLGPTLAASAIMSYGLALAFVVLLFVSFMLSEEKSAIGNVLGLILSPVLAIFVAYLLAAIGTAPSAWFGAYAIDKAGNRYTMVAVAAAVLLAAIVQQLLVTLPLLLVLNAASPAGETPDLLSQLLDWSFIGHVIGWIIGLWASGFPGLVKTGTSVRSAGDAIPGVDG